MKRIVSLFLLVFCGLSASCQILLRDSSEFKLPYKPGSTEWERLKTTSARTTALQIPKDILAKISTKGLLEVCLDYPYTYDMFAYNDFDMGFNSIQKKFNGFKELLRREDLVDALLDKYEKIPQYHSKVQDRAKNVDMPSLRMFLIVYMTGLDFIFNKMTESQLKHLEKATEYNLKQLEGETTIDPMILGAIKRMRNSLKRTQSQQDYSEGNIFYGDNGNYRVRIKQTPNGSSVISGELISADLSSQLKSDYRYLAEVIHGGIYESEATKQYNCHAYAWHMSQGHSEDLVWIGFAEDNITAKKRENIYWEDGSYIEVPEAIATHIAYDEESADHSAIRYDSLRYISKWGPGCLVIHLPNEVPYNTNLPKKFYHRTPIISGSSALCDSNDYSVTNLPSGASVSWNMTIDGDSTAAQLSVNTPAINQCQISRTGPQYLSFTATLTATIIYQNDTIAVLSKDINAPALSLPIPYVIINTETDRGTGGMVGSFNNINLNPNVMYYLNSLYFNGKTPSLQVSPINGNYMFTPADSNGYHVMVPQGGSVIAVFSDGCTTTNWIFWGRNSAYLMSIGGGEGQLIVDITENDSAVSEVTDTRSKEEMPVSLDNLEWTLEVYEASAFRKVKTVDVKGNEYTLDTSSLPKGIYIIRAIVGKEILSEKITIK